MIRKHLLDHEKLKIRLKVIAVLLDEFKFRRHNNINYSIRSFASDIGMNYVHLSQVLRNQQGLSRKKAEQITREFNLNITERRRFHLLVAACGRSILKRNLALMGLRNNLVNRLRSD